MKFFFINGVLVLIGEEIFVFVVLGDMVFFNRGIFCGWGGRGDFEVVVMFVCLNYFVFKFLEVFGNLSEYWILLIESKG